MSGTNGSAGLKPLRQAKSDSNFAIQEKSRYLEVREKQVHLS
jgi:hypothetical protein